ncbi:hypothetical protein GSI_09770 [Ganoderma sinense ZZ0214-1]|uniref:Fungal-type protein kinase domain-containing protein n=1 Tax=Ganoderma sinense ZZ0214-1 TaxID=1077348 RepID=A0A2G8S2X3_9APHY|nr:hypothetical protein GSI_09770 [Ganoderma sinense ZZ0214-1]
MSGVNATPLTVKSKQHPVVVEETNKGGQHEGWAQEIVDRIHVSKDRTDVYLRKFVPSTARCPLTDDFTGRDLFSDWTPTAGKEKESYDTLVCGSRPSRRNRCPDHEKVKGFTELVSTFPEDKRPAFFKAYRVQQQFPFSAFAKDHHKSYPDIAVSFPGVKADALGDKPKWCDIALTMEAKAMEADDPFDKDGLEHVNRQIQLAINARGLMHAHGFLSVFILGVYGHRVRFVRFDHACAVVSKSLSLKDRDHVRLIQRFFWRLVHPCDGGVIVGADPTVRKLTAEDRDWVAPRLRELGIDLKTFVWEEARRAEVPCTPTGDLELDPSPGEPNAFILLKALGVNGRLFSRSTTAWLGLRDTRRWTGDGQLQAEDDGSESDSDSGDPAPLQLAVVKEAWRQLVRQPESDFYARLRAIDEDKRVGLPGLLCGGDMGEWEVRRWEASLYDDSTDAPQPATNNRNGVNHGSRLAASRTRAVDSELPPTASPTPLLSSLAVGEAPYPRPMHQTFTWRQLFGDKYWHRERSHMRLVLDKVGRPLNSFKTTRELAVAMRDAIRGHRAAMSGAGILHRDVSIGNILIVDDVLSKTSRGGFLHDFDFSTMSCAAPEGDLSSLGAEALSELLIGEDGTYYFMAINLLFAPSSGIVHTISHDLESFYWVLVWVVLRYTSYTHHFGDNTFLTVFPAGDDRQCAGAKTVWVKHEAKGLTIPGNQPLTDLMLALSAVMRKCSNDDALDYDLVLQCFDDALAPDKKWPENDKAVSRALPDLRTNSVMPANNRMGSKKKRHHRGGSKRKVAEGAEPPPLREDVEGPVYYDDDADPVAVREDDTGPAPRPTLVRQADQLEDEAAPAGRLPSKRLKTNSGKRSARDHRGDAAGTSGGSRTAPVEVGSTDVAGPSTGTRSRTRANNASRGAGSGRATGSRQASGREGGSRAKRSARGESGSRKLRG